MNITEDLSSEERAIVNQYVLIHQELATIKEKMIDMEKRSNELLDELERLRELEKNKKQNGEEKRI